MMNLIGAFLGLVLLCYVVWTPIYLFSDNAVDIVEDLTIEDIFELRKEGVNVRPPHPKLEALIVSGAIDINEPITELLEKTPYIEDVEVEIIKSDKFKVSANNTIDIELVGVSYYHTKLDERVKTFGAMVIDKDFIRFDLTRFEEVYMEGQLIELTNRYPKLDDFALTLIERGEFKKGIKILEEAVTLGSATSASKLYLLYATPSELMDETKAEHWLSVLMEMAEDGDSLAPAVLMSLYKSGTPERLKWKAKAENLANAGDAKAQYILASVLAKSGDKTGSAKYLSSAEEQGMTKDRFHQEYFEREYKGDSWF